jgi:hypothetical protein
MHSQTVLVTGMAWLVIISVPVWGDVREKLLPLSSLEWKNLVRIKKSLLPDG